MGWHLLVPHAGAQVLPPTVYLIGTPVPPPPSLHEMVEPPPLADTPIPLPDIEPILMPGDLSLSDIVVVPPLTVDPLISVALVIPPPPEVIVYTRTCWHEHRHVYCSQPRIDQ
jgi:hypothetical protein